jgi:UDP-glucose 4-epimerase
VTNARTSWSDVTCIVTGGVGFLGSHLSDRLVNLGARTIVLDIELGHPGTLFWHKKLHARSQIISQDCSASTAIDTIRSLAPDYIFHLAGLPYAPYTTAHPSKADIANVTSTRMTLEAMRDLPETKLIFSSSACVFGATRQSPLNLDSPYSEPTHYYTITKRRAEYTISRYRQEYGLDVAICRFGNIYGPGDRHFGRIVPQICSQLIVERRDHIRLYRSRGNSIFEFLYVEDAVDGLLGAAAANNALLPVLHFTGGMQSRVDILTLVRLMSRIYDGKTREIIRPEVASEGEVIKYLDGSATSEFLGFQPVVDLGTGLSRTLDWYQLHIGELKPHVCI